MKHYLMIGILAMGFTACGPSHQANLPAFSTLASFEIDDLAVPQGLPAWASLNVVMKNASDGKVQIEKTYKKGDKTSDATLVVKYGEYKILLKYLDGKGKTVYQSCVDDEKFVHKINEAVYEPSINLCSIEAVVGNGESIVKLEPVLKTNSGSSTTTVDDKFKKINFTWGGCVPDKGPAPYGSYFRTVGVDISKNTFSDKKEGFPRRDCTLASGEKKTTIETLTGKASAKADGDTVFVTLEGKNYSIVFTGKLEGNDFKILIRCETTNGKNSCDSLGDEATDEKVKKAEDALAKIETLVSAQSKTQVKTTFASTKAEFANFKKTGIDSYLCLWVATLRVDVSVAATQSEDSKLREILKLITDVDGFDNLCGITGIL